MELMTRYSKLIDAKLRKALVLKDGVIFNNKFEGSAKAGTVKVRRTGAAQVQDYDKANGVALTAGTSQYIPVIVDKDKAVNEIIDGFDAAAVPDNMVADRLDEASYGIALGLDMDGAIELCNGGTVLEDTAAVTAKTVYGKLVDVRTALTKAGVPNDGRRYVIVNPDVMALILKADEFIKASDLGDAVVQTGAVGKIAGMLVFESANLVDGVEFVAGHPDYATRIKEWAVDVHVQDLAGSGKFIGACAVQGRNVYAHKVSNAAAILVKATSAFSQDATKLNGYVAPVTE